MNQQGPTHHELKKHARLDVYDFGSDQHPNEVHDWLYSIKAFFRWYDVSNYRKLQFAEAKLKGIAYI